MKLLMYFALLVCCQARALRSQKISLDPVKVEFEIQQNQTSTHHVRIQKMVELVRVRPDKEFRITIEATSPVVVYLGNCGEKVYKLGSSQADDLLLADIEILSTTHCHTNGTFETLEVSVVGNNGTYGHVTFEIIEKALDLINFEYKFNITDYGSNVYLNISDFENAIRIMERFDQLKMLIDQAKNITVSLVKCGKEALHFAKFSNKNAFTFQSEFIKKLQDVVLSSCKTQPMQLLVSGPPNTAGKIIFQVVPLHKNTYNVFWGAMKSVIFPFAHISILFVVIFTVIPLIWWTEKKHRNVIKHYDYEQTANE